MSRLRFRLGVACAAVCVASGIGGGLSKESWPFVVCLAAFYVSDWLLVPRR